MKIICCKCGKEYLLEDNVYSSEKANRPILRCPHCGFKHLLDFMPFNQELGLKKLNKLNLTTIYYVDVTASRIANSNRADQSGSDDNPVTGWTKTDDFILGIQVGTSKGPLARAYKLQRKNITQDDPWADVTDVTDISYSADTVLGDGTTLGSGNKLCTGTPEPTWQDGLESEGDNLLPDSGTYSLADEYYSEFQWALDCDGATDGEEYALRLYDVTQGVSVGEALAHITMAAGAATQTLYPGGIASLEAFGTDKLNFKMFPSAIGSLEAFGTLKLNHIISPSAIASLESFGTNQLNFRIFPVQVSSGEAFGNLTLGLFLLPTAIGSLEGLGTPGVNHRISPTAIASLEGFGNGQLNLRIFPAELAGGESFGTALVNAQQTLLTSQFPAYRDIQLLDDGELEQWNDAFDLTYWTEVTAGTNTVNRESSGVHGGTYCARLDVDDDADDCFIAQQKSPGAGKVVEWGGWYKTSAGKIGYILILDSGANVYLNEKGEWEATPAAALVLSPSTSWKEFRIYFETHPSYSIYNMYLSRLQTAVGSIWFDDIDLWSTKSERFGTPVVKLVQSLYPPAIASLEAFGTSQLNLRIFPIALGSGESFGTLTLGLYLLPSAIGSEEGVGSPKLNLVLLPTGIASLEAFGTTLLKLYLLPSSIGSEEAFGALQLNLRILPGGIASLESFGTPTVISGMGIQTLYPDEIVSLEAFGDLKINFNIEPLGIASLEAFGISSVRELIIYIGTLVGLFCAEDAKHFPGILIFEAKLEDKLIAEAKLEKSLVTEGKLEECP